LVVVAIDFGTKQWALMALESGATVPLLGDLLSLTLVFNSGAALSIGDGRTYLLTVIALIVTAGLLYYSRRARPGLGDIIFGLAIGGALGNLFDRLFRDPGFGQGHVVDMIKYGELFVGNVADIAIVVAAGLFLIASFGTRSVLVPAKTQQLDVETVSPAGDEDAARGV
jgi:signal peptidase II